MKASIRIGIVTCSDRATAGVYQDISGKEIENVLREYISSEWAPEYRLIEDDQAKIEYTLTDLADKEDCCLIITTGGTGPAARDVTPEATENVCTRMLPGFGELMRSVSLKQVPTAILSRQTAGIRNTTLIVNLPGKPRAIRQCMEAVFPAIPYCIDLIGGAYIETTDAIACFRPAS